MPRYAADQVTRFRNEISCTMLDHVRIHGSDPFFNDKPTLCREKLGPEGWLASYLYANGIEFKPLPSERGLSVLT